MIYTGRFWTRSNEESRNMKTLDIGCGKNKTKGATGIDRLPGSDADVIHDLNRFPYPFEDNAFDLVICRNVLEHLDDVVGVMTEIHRICRPGARVEILVPHFSSVDAFTDITHKHFFSSHSFDYFVENMEYSFYTGEARFLVLKKQIRFGLRGKVLPFLGTFARLSPDIYEKGFSFIFPAQTVEFILRADK
ncbi:MAG: methyltransferase domain-containing protein [Elusimicrobiota bacterium]